MSKLSGAYYEIHHMNNVAERDQWMNQIHPLVKLILTILYIANVVSISKYNIAGILIMGIYPIVVFSLGEVSFKDSIRRLRVVLPVVCLLGLFNPVFDRQVLLYVENIPITSGMLSMVTLMLKGIYSVLATYLLIATTTIEKICYALRLLHVPTVLVTQVLLTYRYISVLLKEANTMMQAYSLRAPGQKGIHYKVWGPLAGQLLLRSIDRANDVYASMVLRGYHGEFYLPEKKRMGRRDYVYFLAWALIFALLRILV